VTLKGLTW